MLQRYWILFFVIVWPVFAGATGAVTEATTEHDDAFGQLNEGQQAFDSGRFARALDQWDRAADTYRRIGDVSGLAQALVGKGNAYLALGRYPRAEATFHEAGTLARQAGELRLALRAAIGEGSVQVLNDKPAGAKALLSQTLQAASDGGHRDLAAAAAMELGNLLAREGMNDEAADRYRQSLSEAAIVGDQTLAAKAAVNLARVRLEGSPDPNAWSLLGDADARVRRLAGAHERAFLLVAIGGLYRNAAERIPGQAAEAARRAALAYKAAALAARDIADIPTLSLALGHRAELEAAADNDSVALELASEAIVHAQQAQAPEILYRWEWLVARILRDQGDNRDAIATYRRAIANLELIRHDLTMSRGHEGSSFRSKYGALYLELADVLLRQAAQTADAAEVGHYLRDARGTVELLKSAEIEDYFQDDCVTALKAKTSGIDSLATDTAAIYPIVLEDRLEILLSLPDGMQRFVTPVGAKQLDHEVQRFRQLLEKRTTREYLRPARRLYDWVLRPLEPALAQAGIDTLVIVPDGSLRTIPWAALHDGQGFVLERYALATTPGLTLTDPRPIGRERVQVLAAGLTEAVQGFPPLPAVDRELSAISGLYKGKVLENDSFSMSNVETELESGRPYDIVHIASHGQFESDVHASFLLTSDTRLTMDKIEGFLGVTAYRDRPVELLTLSACETAVGDDRAALGLAGVAIKAGARSAVATLWSVNDRASAELVSEFYRQLRSPSLSKADALREAQLAMLHDRRFEHPAYWSPFLLIGNWL